MLYGMCNLHSKSGNLILSPFIIVAFIFSLHMHQYYTKLNRFMQYNLKLGNIYIVNNKPSSANQMVSLVSGWYLFQTREFCMVVGTEFQGGEPGITNFKQTLPGPCRSIPCALPWC